LVFCWDENPKICPEAHGASERKVRVRVRVRVEHYNIEIFSNF
jgi:hypothetical protein